MIENIGPNLPVPGENLLSRLTTLPREEGSGGPQETATISSAAFTSDKTAKKAKRKKAHKSHDEHTKVNYPQINSGAGVYAECFGKISHLALQLDNEAVGPVRDNVLNAWTTLFKTMDPDVRFSLVVEAESDKQAILNILNENKIENPERFNIIMAKDINITMWSRDQMLGLFTPSDENAILNQTTMRPHGDDPRVPPLIAAANQGIILDADKRLVTDGGDEVSNSKETFLGYNSLYLTAKHLFEMQRKKEGRSITEESPFKQNLVTEYPEGGNIYNAPDFHYENNPFMSDQEFDEAYWMGKAKELFEEKYGKTVTVVGADDPSTPEIEQPATFHIDMGLTPVDDKTVFVGCPKKAVDIIKSLPKEEYDSYNKKLSEELGESGDILQRLVDANTTEDPNLQHQFDYNAEHMKQRGYDVYRLPYLQGPPGLPWVTYNNCLMESYKKEDGTEVRRVFLPTFGLPALDNEAAKMYQSQGFQVIPLELAALTSWRGAIRCISNVLGRQPEA